jgi:hypothetical protein
MNTKNTERIINACPSLFASMNTGDGDHFYPINFGFECGDGWADILVELCQKIEQYLKTMPKEHADLFVALQVKEKFGTLRFYVSQYDESIEALIVDAEKKSARVCEQCGKPGTLRGHAWFYTACDEHTHEIDLVDENRPE